MFSFLEFPRKYIDPASRVMRCSFKALISPRPAVFQTPDVDGQWIPVLRGGYHILTVFWSMLVTHEVDHGTHHSVHTSQSNEMTNATMPGIGNIGYEKHIFRHTRIIYEKTGIIISDIRE